MYKRLLAITVLAALLCVACSMDAGEGLLEATFNKDEPISKTILVDVEEDISYVQFFVEAKFDQGSTTVYVYDPEGQCQILALGLTGTTEVLQYQNPLPGKWTLVIHIDGNSETIVDGNFRLALKKHK